MASIPSNYYAFNGGEVTPEFAGRVDDAKFQMGLALCQNFVVLPHGPVANRGGTAFVREVKDSTKRTRLLRFAWSASQTMVLEFGAGYFRFHTNGGTVLDGVSPYELAHPYTESQLFDVRYVQSADVVTLVHPEHPPRELRRLGATNWQLVVVVFGTTAPTPGVPTLTVGGTATNPQDYTYGVTTVAANGDESLLGPTATASTNLNEAGTSIGLAWTAVPGVEYYRVYRYEGGVMAFVGAANSNGFFDEGIVADVSLTPPNAKNPFNGPGNYPAAVTYFEQRRVFAATLNEPQMLWMTRPGTEANLNTSLPVRDDDAVNFRLAARERNAIRHLVPLQDLIVLTEAAGWRVSENITPTSLLAKPQAWSGASTVPPLVTNTSLVFAAARGGHVRELGYSQEQGGYTTNDLSLRATHLFDEKTIVDAARAEAPYPVLWFVASTGVLLGCTYLPEQNIAAWHQHPTTNGAFESVAVVGEGEDDVLYAVVRREINGQTVRYVERMASRRVVLDSAADGFFVDAGAEYVGAPVSGIAAGLDHLEGEMVSVLADGKVLPAREVVGGGIALDFPASRVVVGLPISARVQTLPFSAQIAGLGQGRTKKARNVWARLFRSRSLFVGTSFDDMLEVKPRVDEPLGEPPALHTGPVEIVPVSGWEDDGQVCIEQRDPLPLTLLALMVDFGIGG